MARILFLTDFSEAYARNLLLGIARYAHAVGQAWSLCRLPLSIRDKFGIEAVIDLAKKMRADAVIGQFYNTDNVELFARNGIITIAQDFKARFTTIPNITGPHFLAGKWGRVLRQERIPPLRLLRHARRRLVRRAHAGFPRNGPCREPVVHLLGVVQEHAERPVGLRHEPAGDLAAVTAQTGGDHGLRRQPRLPHHRSLPAGRGGVGCASPTTSRCWA